jgi:hypothetical protein
VFIDFFEAILRRGIIWTDSSSLDPTTAGIQNTISKVSGVWGVDASGVVTFTPALNFNGPASVIYCGPGFLNAGYPEDHEHWSGALECKYEWCRYIHSCPGLFLVLEFGIPFRI